MVLILIFAEVLGLYGCVNYSPERNQLLKLSTQPHCSPNYEHKSHRDRLLAPGRDVFIPIILLIHRGQSLILIHSDYLHA
jgi:hypothetical protein